MRKIIVLVFSVVLITACSQTLDKNSVPTKEPDNSTPPVTPNETEEKRDITEEKQSENKSDKRNVSFEAMCEEGDEHSDYANCTFTPCELKLEDTENLADGARISTCTLKSSEWDPSAGDIGNLTDFDGNIAASRVDLSDTVFVFRGLLGWQVKGIYVEESNEIIELYTRSEMQDYFSPLTEKSVLEYLEVVELYDINLSAEVMKNNDKFLVEGITEGDGNCEDKVEYTVVVSRDGSVEVQDETIIQEKDPNLICE